MQIYLAGAMGALSFEEQTRWRKQVQDAIRYGDYDCSIRPTFFSPPNYYNFEEKHHKSEREVMEYDLNRLRNSDLVIVNFNDASSIGTAMELAVARENRIPIVGLNEHGVALHPWLAESVGRMCDNMRELIEYVVEYYLN